MGKLIHKGSATTLFFYLSHWIHGYNIKKKSIQHYKDSHVPLSTSNQGTNKIHKNPFQGPMTNLQNETKLSSHLLSLFL
jgi:hypothetical protein